MITEQQVPELLFFIKLITQSLSEENLQGSINALMQFGDYIERHSDYLHEGIDSIEKN